MLYAAYGSNLHPLRLRMRVASAQLVGTREVAGWVLGFNKRSLDGSAKCNIQPAPACIHVAVFDISLEDKRALDEIEGAGTGYSEISLDVPDIGTCFSYTAMDEYIVDSLAPYDWYTELVLLGACEHEFPAAYVDRICSVSTMKDRDAQRRASMWSTVRQIDARYTRGVS